MILDNAYVANSISQDSVIELAQKVSAFAMQIIGDLGGIRVVELLLVIGFIMGLLACIYEIKMIER